MQSACRRSRVRSRWRAACIWTCSVTQVAPCPQPAQRVQRHAAGMACKWGVVVSTAGVHQHAVGMQGAAACSRHAGHAGGAAVPTVGAVGMQVGRAVSAGAAAACNRYASGNFLFGELQAFLVSFGRLISGLRASQHQAQNQPPKLTKQIAKFDWLLLGNLIGSRNGFWIRPAHLLWLA